MLAAAAERTKTHQAEHRRHRAQLRRSGAGLRAVRHARSAVRRPRRDHGRTRLVHRIAFRCSATTSTTTTSCLPRSSNCWCKSATTSSDHLAGRASRAAPGPGRLSAHAEQNSDLGRGRRQPAIGDPRRRAEPADGARHHRRPAGALCAVRQPVPPGRKPCRPRCGEACTRRQHPRLCRRHLAASGRRVLPELRGADEPHRPRARLAADDARAFRGGPAAARPSRGRFSRRR